MNDPVEAELAYYLSQQDAQEDLYEKMFKIYLSHENVELARSEPSIQKNLDACFESLFERDGSDLENFDWDEYVKIWLQEKCGE